MKHIFQKFLKNIPLFPQQNTENKAQLKNERKSLFTITNSFGTISLFSLLIPMLLESVMGSMIGTVNTLVLSGFSEKAVAAVGASNSLVNMFNLLSTVVATGASVVISNLIGSEKKERTANACFTAIVACSFMGLVCSVLLSLNSAFFISLLNLEGEIFDMAVVYFKIRTASLVVISFSSILQAVLRCYGYPKFTIIIGITSNIFNLFLNIYVIYYRNYSPIDGVAAIAICSIISVVIGMLLAILFTLKLKISIKFPKSPKIFFDLTIRILKIGLPSGISGCSFTVSQVVATSFIALLGGYVLSAKVYFSTILSYAYLFSMNLGLANSLLVGRLCGAKDYEHAEKLNRTLIKITTVVNFSISMFIFLFRKQLLSGFTDDTRIIELALGIMLVDLVVEQARAISQIYEYALRAAGDVTFTLIVVTLSCWLCGVGLAYFLTITCGFGLIGCWYALAIDEWIRTVATYFRWRTGKWKKISVL